MSLVFELAAPAPAPARQRADIACFIGHVARRPQRPLPAALRAQLQAAGWVAGPWARPAQEVESLLNLPIALDSWQLFDALFAWEQRPLGAGTPAVCASYLGAAVRSFFARGGRRAIVIRAGDPWPVLESGADRAAQRGARIRRLLPGYAEGVGSTRPFEPHHPASWQGIHHLYGLREASMLLLPDLPDACCVVPPLPDATLPPTALPEGFVECSVGETEAPPDRGLRRIPAPRLDSDGFDAWQRAMAVAHDFLADARNRRELLLVAALPLPDPEARRVVAGANLRAQADLPAFLQRLGVLRDDGPGVEGQGASSAFVQLAWPWLATAAAAEDLPEALEPPDGVLAGLVAAGATLRGCFRSVAGDFSMPRLRDVAGAEPLTPWSLDETSPSARLAAQVCVFAPLPGGWALQSDVTGSPHKAWRFGGASRLMGTLLRAARAAGDELAFDANGPVLWARVRATMEDMLLGFWRAGAFAGASAERAFAVRCDRSTMTQADLDAGRLIVEISVWPAQSIERITVVLALGDSAGAEAMRVAA